MFNQVEHGTPAKACEGSAIKQILDFLARKGSTTFNSFPDQDFCKPAAATPISATPVYHIPGYQQLAYSRVRDGVIEMTRPLDIDLARQTLSHGDPIVIGFSLTDPKLADLGAEDIYRSDPDYNVKHSLGGHAMLIVGYDNQKRAFRIMNSWGPKWADRGYGWIDYETVRTHAREAFAVTASVDAAPAEKIAPEDVRAAKGECAAVQVEKSDDVYVLQGFVERDADRVRWEHETESAIQYAGLKDKVGLRDDLQVFPWPQCEAVIVLADQITADEHPTLDTLDGRKTIKIGEMFGFDLTAPDYPSYMYLIYLQADGSAVNLMPRQGAERAQVPPNTRLRIGDPQVKGPHFRASDPPGREAVVAIAASHPIPQLEALEQSGGLYRLATNDKGEDAASGVRRVLSAINDGVRAATSDANADAKISASVILMSIEK